MIMNINILWFLLSLLIFMTFIILMIMMIILIILIMNNLIWSVADWGAMPPFLRASTPCRPKRSYLCTILRYPFLVTDPWLLFRNFGQNRFFLVLWESSENQFGRPKIFFFWKSAPSPRENPRSAPGYDYDYYY